jgi:hypothetical protein
MDVHKLALKIYVKGFIEFSGFYFIKSKQL